MTGSEYVLGELRRKLVEKFRFPEREVDHVAAFLRRSAAVVEPPILGTAVGGDCALLISVDRDLLDMGRIDEIPIIRPGEYWRRTTENG